MATKLEDGRVLDANGYHFPDGTLDRRATIELFRGSRAGNQLSNFAGGFSVDRIWPPRSAYGGE